MTDKFSFKSALALASPQDELCNALQTPSSMTDQDKLEEGEITEEDCDVSSTSTTSAPSEITCRLLKVSSDTFCVPNSESASAQSSRLSSTSTICDSTMTATLTTPQYPDPDIGPMTHEDLDHVKNLILDLLGWGVSPQYLVGAGVSVGVLHRVFTELNLRLPTNLVLPSAWPLSTIIG